MGFYDRYILPWLLDRAMRRSGLAALRQSLLADAVGDVLEVGFGSGLNLPYYPREVRNVTGVEPDPGMRARAMARIEASGRTVSLVARGIDKRLALPGDSFDTVVSTWTFCTIADPHAAMKEIHRLLKRGGRFLFVEHGVSPDAGVARWQQLLSGVTRRCGGGCNLNRDIEGIVRRSKLAVGKVDKFYMPDALRVGGFTYRGVAVKP
jgi:SAM-dependent methyltransferase